MKLERYLAQGELRYDFETQVETRDRMIVRTLPLFDQLLEYQVRTEQDKADIAYSFLHALLTPLVELAADACTRSGTNAVGLTGGVSYDLPIVRMAEALVKAKGLTFLTHERIPNGDGGISVGQNVIAGHLI
jgi:hydrogenase maturation protein HypF